MLFFSYSWCVPFFFGSGECLTGELEGDGFDFFILSVSQLFRFLVVVCIWKDDGIGVGVCHDTEGDFFICPDGGRLCQPGIRSIFIMAGTEHDFVPALPAGKGNGVIGKQNGDAVIFLAGLAENRGSDGFPLPLFVQRFDGTEKRRNPGFRFIII